MKKLLNNARRGPLYEKTQGAETNNIIVCSYIALGVVTAAFWLGIALVENTPWLIRAPVLATALLLGDRAVWMMCHSYIRSTVTDTPNAHSFERTSLFPILLVWLMSNSYEQFGDGGCEPKPDTGVTERTNEVTGEVTRDYIPGICDLIQNSAAPALIWALCTVPILLLLGAGWKTLKATSKQSKTETVWLPVLSTLFVLPDFVRILVYRITPHKAEG